MTVTLKTVAERAQVSTTTASRVLSGKGQAISAATTERVLRAARELNYRPNRLAAGLRTRRTRTVGLIVGDIADAYFHVLARGVEDVAQAEGYQVVLCNTDRVAEREVRVVDMLQDKHVDGIIFAGGAIDDDRHLLGRDWGRAWVVMAGPHRLPFPTIGVDNRAAIRDGVLHLAEQGCRRIACIGPRRSWRVSRERMAGYRSGLRDAGLDAEPALVWECDYTFDAGFAAVRRALAAGLRFDAVIAFKDYTAVGVMEALREAGIRVPDQVAVVGCDDMPLATMVRPQLSSIAFPTYELGATAMRTILDLAAGREVPDRIPFVHWVAVRASSLRPRD